MAVALLLALPLAAHSQGTGQGTATARRSSGTRDYRSWRAGDRHHTACCSQSDGADAKFVPGAISPQLRCGSGGGASSLGHAGSSRRAIAGRARDQQR